MTNRIASVALVVAVVTTPFALASDAAVQQGTYKMGKAPSIGDRVPTVGPVFKVYSEGGSSYDFVGEKNRNLDFVLTGTAYCDSPRREGRVSVELGGVSASRSKRGKLGRGVVVGKQFTLSVPHSKLSGFNPVKACNDGLRTLAAERGESKASLIRRGFTLRYEDVFEARATASCSGGLARGHFKSDRTMVDVWVDCRPNEKAAEPKGKPAPKPKRAPLPASLVSSVDFDVDRPSVADVCPTRLSFAGSISASRAGTVRYRVVGSGGTRSPTYTLRFDRAGTKTIRTQAANIKAPPRPPASQTLDSGEGDPPPRTVRGWRRLEIVEPPGVRPSRRAEYRVICLDAPLQLKAVPVRPARPKARRAKPPQ